MSQQGCSEGAKFAVRPAADPYGEVYLCLAHFERWVQLSDVWWPYSGAERCCFLEERPAPPDDKAMVAAILEACGLPSARGEHGRDGQILVWNAACERWEWVDPPAPPVPVPPATLIIDTDECGRPRLCGEWPEEIRLYAACVPTEDGVLLRAGDRILCSLHNGEAEYVIVTEDADVLHCARLYAKVW